MKLKFCPKCGNKLEDHSFQCQSCGVDLSSRLALGTYKQKNLINEEIQATFLERMTAWLIDITIVLSITIPLSFYVNFGYFYIYSYVYNSIIGFFYFWLLELLNKGRTIGKLILRLKTVNKDDFGKAKPSKLFLNNITKPTVFLFFDVLIGLLINHIQENKNNKIFRATQLLAEVIVIKEKKSSNQN
ncbi:MAG: RDD family protein [Promethearchaeia archaeon]